jgi:hypothetical protein
VIGKHTDERYIEPDDNFLPRSGWPWSSIIVYGAYLSMICLIVRCCWR